MEWISMFSSNIDAAAFDDNDHSLYIRFKSGSVYQYPNTDKQIYHGLLNAGSKGSYHAAFIKNRTYIKIS
ncbi:KTSC domain-containing protein [Fructobacillus fructosus]|uniref:KTSC domain-containing protein n=1 Tax=Fructobacillus fructosus TaxID=1631 RepID=UPI002D84E825|nr:hypothetical protein R53140_OCIKHKEL_01114 [Fructobacillus fructosus]CAK1250829.1 hypothetical protein LMG30235_GOPAMIKF_01402 [Fructobacillus fructosus]CAK1252276.1 hypothetical protein LMG30234_GAICNKDF_01476 [Fructobacillus fructosus]